MTCMAIFLSSEVHKVHQCYCPYMATLKVFLDKYEMIFKGTYIKTVPYGIPTLVHKLQTVLASSFALADSQKTEN